MHSSAERSTTVETVPTAGRGRPGDAVRGEYPIGVDLGGRRIIKKKKCGNHFTGKQEHLGYFSNPEEAHEAWRKRKHELAQLVAATESDMRVVEALKKRYSFEEWYKSITPPFRAELGAKH